MQSLTCHLADLNVIFCCHILKFINFKMQRIANLPVRQRKTALKVQQSVHRGVRAPPELPAAQVIGQNDNVRHFNDANR
jgi:hypothetical protein